MPSLYECLQQARRRDETPTPEWAGALGCDDVVLGESEGTLALQVLESAGVSRTRADRSVIVADRHPLARFERADTIAELEARAHACGCQFARPGAGRAEFLYLERCAMPIRIAVTAGIPLERAGALGVVALRADTLEAAAGMACGGFVSGALEDRTLVLEGRLAPGVSGLDLAWALAPRLHTNGARFGVLSVIGSAVSSMPMRDRLQLAGPLAAAVGASVLMPSDATTREWLRARGREADWRSLEVPEGDVPASAQRIEVENVEPMLVAGSGGGARRLVDLAHSPVSAVRFGPDMTLDDAWFVAARLTGQSIHSRTRVTVDAGCAALQEALEACGAWQALVQAGCDVSVAPGPFQPEEGLTLCFGGPAGGRGSWLASLEVCTLAALRGELLDPRGGESGEVGPLPAAAVVSSGWLVPSPATAGDGAPSRATRRGSSSDTSVRGVLLYRGGDDVEVSSLLPWGARLEPEAGDIAGFARHALEALDPEFASRARANDGGFLSAGARFGVGGGAGERAALALESLGVRVLLAESFDPAYRRRLVHAGLLPLRFERAQDRLSFEPGDELELPAPLDALEPARPLVVRNLTRGLQIICMHDLDSRELEVVRAGGLLAHAGRGQPSDGRQE